MAKATPSAALILKDIRAALDSHVDGRGDKAKGILPKSPLKALGVRPSFVRSIAREIEGKTRPSIDYAAALALVDAAVARKVREEILVALEVLDHHQKEFNSGLFAKVEKWIAVADDLEVADVLGTRIAAPALRLEPAKLSTVRKWAKLKSVGKRHLAVLAATGLVMDGHREATAVLNLAEMLLDEQNPLMVGAVARLLRETTRVDAKAVQDFLFRRSIDGNPDILRAGSENLDAARRAALIAKLEAQAALTAPLAAAER
ncbi:MAG TPA: DNA alkylation repair protein [Thermoanaerobaculia bacterium]|nr:DNA alkylation repair protein [Thermoanaerobaculia bacterium]